MMFGWMIALFVGLPLVELALLLKVGEFIGWQRTIILVVATGVIGASLARKQGLMVLRNIQDEINAGRLPASRLIDGAMILVAGVLLITPGMVTDATGFLLLAPPVRRVLQEWARTYLDRKMQDGSGTFTFRRM